MALLFLFRSKFNRWLKLKEPPTKTQRFAMDEGISALVDNNSNGSQIPDSDESVGESNNRRKFRDPRFVCPVRPDQSFMSEQKPFIEEFNTKPSLILILFASPFIKSFILGFCFLLLSFILSSCIC